MDMDRRSFFTRGAKQVGKQLADEKINNARQRARHWIRPPFALDELEFLLACTRCGECISACPHDVIFALSPRLGIQVVGTPALDLGNKGCHLCQDWPCVQSCEPRALQLPPVDQDQIANPQPFAKVSINTTQCLPYQGPECAACDGSCPVPDTFVFISERPQINHATCTGCALCREACIVEPKAIDVRSIYAT